MSRIIPTTYGKLPYLRFPIHYKGAPQRRLFFPDWYLKVVKPPEKMPPNYVRFHVPHDMTKYDVREYLDKIYQIPIATLTLEKVDWYRFRDEGGPWKFMEPYKIAHVRLGEGQTFQFPELVKKDKDPDEYNPVETSEETQKMLRQYKESETPEGEKSSRVRARLDNKWLG